MTEIEADQKELLRSLHTQYAAQSTCPECGHKGATPYGTLVYPTSVNQFGHPVMSGLPYDGDRYRCDSCAYSWKMPELHLSPLPSLEELSERLAPKK